MNQLNALSNRVEYYGFSLPLGGPRKIAVAGNRGHLWGEQHRIETRTKRNHSRVNSGRLTIGGNFSRSPWDCQAGSSLIINVLTRQTTLIHSEFPTSRVSAHQSVGEASAARQSRPATVLSAASTGRISAPAEITDLTACSNREGLHPKLEGVWSTS